MTRQASCRSRLRPSCCEILQEREFERVGGTRSLSTDVRVIAATNRDLHAQVEAGSFRSDLYYRLNVFPIVVPPLRERRDDIPGLVRHFAAKAARKLGRTLDAISPAFVERRAPARGRAISANWKTSSSRNDHVEQRSAGRHRSVPAGGDAGKNARRRG